MEGETESFKISEIDEKSASAEISEKSTISGPEGSSSEVFRSKSTGLCRRVEKELNESIPGTDDEGTVPPVPKASAQFYRDWRSLKSNQLRKSSLSNELLIGIKIGIIIIKNFILISAFIY